MTTRAKTTWERLNIAMGYFQAYINSKKDKCSLSVIDLLHVSNFKGGNASITEPETSLNRKIKEYENVLREIDKSFGRKNLQELGAKELEELIMLCNKFVALTKMASARMRGLGPSYASAIIAAHYPNLAPVLDRRVLNGAEIEVKYDSQQQVKDIEGYYGALIKACHAKLNQSQGMTLRELDKEWFIKKMP